MTLYKVDTAKLRRLMSEKNLTVFELARFVEFDIVTLEKYFSGRAKRMKHSSLRTLSKALGVEWSDLVKE